MAKGWKRVLGLGVLAGAAWAVWRACQPVGSPTVTWDPQPFPFPPIPHEPDGSGAPGDDAATDRQGPEDAAG